MAWIAALISGGLGLAGANESRKSQKKANQNAGILDSAGYQNALMGIGPYQDIGGKSAESLAQLMGLEGYRTAEETAYTNWLKGNPAPTLGTSRAPVSSFEKYASYGPAGWMIDKQAEGLLNGEGNGPSGMWQQGGHFGPLHDVFSSKKKRAARQAALNAQNKANYDQALSAWNARKNELLSASNKSLEGYDRNAATNAILKNSPGYQFRYDTGLETTLNNMAGARKSGNALRGLTEFGQGFASNEFQNEFNRRAALAGIGQSATTTAGNWAIGQAGNQANINLMQGQNDANYYQNLNNIGQGTLNNYLNYKTRNSRKYNPYNDAGY